jgi:8-oxo-dGTP diphosphatase
VANVAHTQVGCELFIRKGNSILLGKRKNCYGAGTWGLPGGHLEFNERLVDAACREALEELGLELQPEQLTIISVVDDLQPENNIHYVHVSFEVAGASLQHRRMEPERCEEWRYFPLDALPEDTFPYHRASIENYRAKRLYVYPK